VTALPTVAILAGGLGTRLGALVRETPKPLLVVAGRPFVAWQLQLLARHGARRVVLCVGYRGELIERAVGDGSRYGVEVRYAYDPPELAGTAGALRAALPLLGEAFQVLYGDTYLRVDYRAVQEAWRESGLPALMTVLRNDGRWDASNALYRDGRVIRYDKRSPSPDMRWIDYGLGVLTPRALELTGDTPDLPEAYHRLAEAGLLAGYEASERFYEIGTPESLAEVEAFLRGLGSERRASRGVTRA